MQKSSSVFVAGTEFNVTSSPRKLLQLLGKVSNCILNNKTGDQRTEGLIVFVFVRCFVSLLLQKRNLKNSH